VRQYDKARVPIGLNNANITDASTESAYLTMTTGNKLIPCVYSGIQIQSNGLGNREAVDYSGPTYIAIRSGKHLSSTAFSHALDFDKLLSLKEFDVITRS
jgi:hypothetical protein